MKFLIFIIILIIAVNTALGDGRLFISLPEYFRELSFFRYLILISSAIYLSFFLIGLMGNVFRNYIPPDNDEEEKESEEESEKLDQELESNKEIDELAELT